MADNYLERRMEDYRSGRLTADLRRTAHRTRTPADVPQDILVEVEEYSPCLDALVAAMVRQGSRVTVVEMADEVVGTRSGNLMAQRTGAMFVAAYQRDKLSALRPRGFDVSISFRGERVAIDGREVPADEASVMSLLK